MASVAGSKPEYRHQLALTVGSKEYRLGTGDEAELQRWVEALRTVVRQFKLKLDITTMSSISLAEVDGLSHGGGESGIAAAGLVLRRRLSAVSLSAVGAVAGATDYVLNAIPTRKVGVAAASHIGSTDPSSEPVSAQPQRPPRLDRDTPCPAAPLTTPELTPRGPRPPPGLDRSGLCVVQSVPRRAATSVLGSDRAERFVYFGKLMGWLYLSAGPH